jgi:ketosteroid isomerase-like protein
MHLPDPERDERNIRTQRRLFNEAIAAHDPRRISACWLPDIQVMTSAGISLIGRDAVQRAFEGFFADPAFVTFVRTPTRIQIGADGGDGATAAEHGEWEGHWRGNGQLAIVRRGVYLGSWRKEGGQGGRWLLQCELFVPLSA